MNKSKHRRLDLFQEGTLTHGRSKGRRRRRRREVLFYRKALEKVVGRPFSPPSPSSLFISTAVATVRKGLILVVRVAIAAAAAAVGNPLLPHSINLLEDGWETSAEIVILRANII